MKVHPAHALLGLLVPMLTGGGCHRDPHMTVYDTKMEMVIPNEAPAEWHQAQLRAVREQLTAKGYAVSSPRENRLRATWSKQAIPDLTGEAREIDVSYSLQPTTVINVHLIARFIPPIAKHPYAGIPAMTDEMETERLEIISAFRKKS